MLTAAAFAMWDAHCERQKPPAIREKDKAMLHCDFRAQCKISSYLRFRLVKVLEIAVGAVFAPTRFSSVRISIRNLVADGKCLLRNSGVGVGVKI